MQLDSRYVVIDLETPYGPGYSLQTMNYDEYIYDPKFTIFGIGVQFQNNGAFFVPQAQVGDWIRLMNWADYIVVCHNAYFDGAVLSWLYNVRPKAWADTMLMYSLLHNGESATLDFMSRRLWPDDPSMRKTKELDLARGHYSHWPEEHMEALIRYTLNDVELTTGAFELLLPDVPASEWFTIDDTLRKFFYPVLELDPDKLEETLIQEQNRKQDALAYVGLTATQLSSNKQFEALLEGAGARVPLKRSPTTGKLTPAFSKNDLGFQELQRHPNERVRSLVEARLIIKSTGVETRAKTLLKAHECHNGKCPIPLRAYAAHTLRFGGMDKRNFQNFPREGGLREAIIPPEGHILYVVDWSAIEARMLAFLAGHLELLQMFREGKDIYVEFASRLFGIPPEEVNKTQRFIGKVAILGLGYGMGHNKFQLILAQGAMGPSMQITLAESGRIVNLYRTVNHPIPKLWARCEFLIGEMIKGSDSLPMTLGPVTVHPDRIVGPNGSYIRYTPNKLMDYFGGKLVENIVQYLCRLLLIRANEMVYDQIGLRSAFHVHDELIYCLPIEEAEACKPVIDQVMITPPSWAEELPLAVEGAFHSRYTK